MPKKKKTGSKPIAEPVNSPSSDDFAAAMRKVNEAWAKTVLVDKNGKPFNMVAPDKDRIVGSFLGSVKPVIKEDEVSDEEFNKLCSELGITPEDAIRFTKLHRND